jgi:diguanylate cyclase (GGDEF)-like protein
VTADVTAFARAWASALDTADYVPALPSTRSALVTALAERVAAALSAERFDPRTGHRIGADLVASGYASPEALGRTITVLYTRSGGPAARVTAVTEAVVAGFVAAVHDRALDAQEAVRVAAMSAQARAEQALHAGEARFREFATHDALTGLPNRTLFTQRLNERLAATGGAPRVGVCCIDLDGFAAVNDSLGHGVGDRLLVVAADRLRLLTANAGHLVARLDSDQFAILVGETTCAEDAVKIADRALAALAEPFYLDGTELPLTASAGVVERDATGADTAELIRTAQIALHWAKADGRARWRLFDPERGAREAARYRLSAAIPAALRHGEFTLHYQPLVGLSDGRLVGVEALARWQHATHGLLSAEAFIGLAEDTGLIVPLSTHLLTQACRQAARWQRLVPDPPYVSVNLSPRHLHDPGLVGWVAEVLDRTGLLPSRLHLEITERAVIDTTGRTTTALSALVDLGVRIAIDDFGVGYSNLACLRALPVHGLKLDGTFNNQPRPEHAQRDDDFLAAAVALGHTLGLTVTAEGIETADQARRMRAAGCDNGQGWHLGLPVPANELTRRIREDY